MHVNGFGAVRRALVAAGGFALALLVWLVALGAVIWSYGAADHAALRDSKI